MKKHIFNKFLITIGFIYAFAAITYAQEKPEKRVYYLDCSASMVGSEKHPEDNIWDDVKLNLKNAIDAVSDETTELLIIPFANNEMLNPVLPLECKRALATESGKRQLRDYIDNLPTPDFQIQKTMTYHKIPLEDFVNHRIDKSKETYMFLMTDGDDEERRKYGTETFNKIIENNWNNYSINDDVYGFYVMLNPALEDRSETTQDRKRGAEIRARRNLINDTEYFWYVNSANININIIKLQNNLVYNIRNEKNINIGYKGDLQGLSFELIAPSNAPFEIKEVKQNGDKLNVSISRKDNIDIHTLLESKEYTIKVKMNGADEFTRLVSPNLTLNCISQKENNLTVTHTQAAKSQSFSTWDNIKSKLGFDIDKSASFGTVHYHPKFLWSPENTTPVIDSIYFNFSQDAKLNGSTYAEFQFVDNNGHPYNDETLIIFDGDEVLNNNTIKITSADYAKELKFIFSPEAESGKHQGYFRLISHGQLHRIDHYFLDHLESKTLTANKQDPNNQVNVFQWTLHFKKHINPLLLLIIWIFILLCFLVFLTWLTFKLHRCFAAKFPKNWAIRFRNDENNIVLEPARVGKYFYKNRGTLLDGKSATIHTHILSKEHIKEIIISRNSQNNFHHPWYGDTIYISCDFKNYDIDYIKILPRRRCIHMSVYYTNQFIESPQEIILKVDNNKFESNKQNITDGLTVFAFIPVVKNINNSLNN